ncbi:cysteine proteinase [Serendipita vermifera]|nr:cysteine proteinase [Serendipita vermifera]
MENYTGSKIYEQIREDPTDVETSNVVVEQNLAATVVDKAAAETGQTLLEPTTIKQDERTIGLLVTDQLDDAIQRCKDHIEDISRSCRSQNQKFRDREFDIDQDRGLCLYGLDETKKVFAPSDVMRVTDIFEDPVFFLNGPSSSDMAQGANGNGYFMAALGVVATIPGLIEKICVARDEEVGVYGFIFFRDGLWQEVIIDDQLFVSAVPWGDLDLAAQARYKRDPNIYDSIARRGSKVLYFAKSLNENETWVPLIEKAFAKFYGNFAYINGGITGEAVEDLTGGTSTMFMLKDYLNKTRLWEELAQKKSRDKLYAVSFLQTSKEKETQGLRAKLTYSVLRAAEYNGKKFVVIRNPWGNTEWKGAWSDGSKEWTKEWLPALDILEHTFGEDGQFVMEFSDFLKQWRYLDCVRLFDSNWVVSNIWVAVKGLKLDHPWTWGDVSFTIHVNGRTPAIIALQQLDRRSFRELSSTMQYDFDFVIFKKGLKRVYAKSTYELFGNRSRNVEVDLEPGDYVVHVRIDSKNNADYLATPSPTWNSRRLKRITSRKVSAFSKAINFVGKDIDTKVPIDLDLLAGEDLNEVEINLVRAKREAAQSRKKLKEEAKEANHKEKVDQNKASTKGEDKAALPTLDPTRTHKSVKCDVCQMLPIVGTRYRCANSKCHDFDMCQGCFEKKVHNEEHEIIIISVPRAVVHVGIKCSTCIPKTDVVGTLYKCTVQGCNRPFSCQACKDKKPHDITHSIRMLPVPEKSEEEKNKEAGKATHKGISCDGCGMSPVIGTRFKCLESNCPDYNLCEGCQKRGVHPISHHMLPIVEPEESSFFNPVAPEDTAMTVLGLRVYTQKSVPSVLEAQFRHGSLRTNT